jgi:hypothetical protein
LADALNWLLELTSGGRIVLEFYLLSGRKYREADIGFSHGDTWDRMFRQGVQLLERLAQYDRIEITRHVHGNWRSTHSSYFIDWRSEDLSSFE